MLASTIQFSKYGQENQPQPPLTSNNAHQGKTHPSEHHHPQFGEGRPQPHTYTNPEIRKDPAVDAVVTQKNRSNLCYQDWPDSSGPNSAPRRSTPPRSRSTLSSPKRISSTSTLGLAARLMVNVPQSEAPPPRNECPGNDE